MYYYFFLYRELKHPTSDFDVSSFDVFLKEVKNDYENHNPQLCVALDKFAERYKAAKLQSTS